MFLFSSYVFNLLGLSKHDKLMEALRLSLRTREMLHFSHILLPQRDGDRKTFVLIDCEVDNGYKKSIHIGLTFLTQTRELAH